MPINAFSPLKQASYKTIAFCESLQNRLNILMNGSLVFGNPLTDSDGYPYISAGPGTAGGNNVVIKFTNYLVYQNQLASLAGEPAPYFDELGMSPTPYSPTVIQIVTEAFSSSGLGNGANASGTLTISSGSGTVGGSIGGTSVTVTWTTSDAATGTALKTAINANTTVNKLVVATDNGAGVVTVTALPGFGTAGNSIGLTASGTGVTASAAHLAGGTTATGAGSATSLVAAALLYPVLGDLFVAGTIFQFFLTASGTAPAPSTGTLQFAYEVSNQYGIISTN